MIASSHLVSLRRLDGGQDREVEDLVAVEEPLELRVQGRSLAVVMRTPGHDRELAAGFLVTEGIVRQRDDLLDLVRCGDPGATHPENRIDARLAPGVAVDWERFTRHVFTSSSCGLCGAATVENVRRQFPPLSPPARRPARAWLALLPERLIAAQAVFSRTGGLHASALFALGQTEPLLVREDVGRHNALDKVIGRAWLDGGTPLDRHLLLVSGRVSFEILQKALSAGIGAVAALSAPTSLAVEFARANGQTLVGFLRGERMNVYAGQVE